MRAALALLVLLAGCTKKASPRDCFDVTTAITSKSTREVFERRACQGGGVTWAAIIGVLTRREGTPELAAETGWTGDVKAMQGGLFSIDEEGDAARFCTNVPVLFERIRAEVRRLNGDPKALEEAMSETTALALECEDEVEFPGPLDPPPPPAEQDAARRRLEDALKAERTWCWPPGSITRWSGQLRFEADGGVTQRELDGGTSTGRWRLEPEGRLEASLPGELHHFDVEASGRLSSHFIDGLRADGTARIIVEELVPGDGCLRPRAP
jgi:hypothetical protein